MMERSTRKNRIDQLFRPELFAVLLMLSPVVDVMTGALLLSGRGGGISALYKGVIFLICLFRLMLGMPRNGWIWTSLLCGMLAMNLTNVVLSYGSSGLAYDGNILLKMLTPICLIGVFELIGRKEPDRLAVCTKRIISFYRIFFPLSLIIPKLLGVGYRTYSYGVGFKGFYYAGNDISIVMVVVTIWNVRELVRHPRKREVLLSGLSLTALLCLGTKTAWLMAAVIVAVFVLHGKRLLWKLVSAAGVFIGGTAFLFLERQEVLNLIGSLRSLYNRYLLSGGTVLTFLLSERDRLIEKFFSLVYRENPLWAFFVGEGAYYQASLIPGDQLIEMDLPDLLIRCGIVCCVLIMGFFGYWYVKYRRYADFGCRFAWLAMVGFSMIAGHVLFSPMSNLVLVIVYLDMMAGRRLPPGVVSQGEAAGPGQDSAAEISRDTPEEDEEWELEEFDFEGLKINEDIIESTLW